MRKSWKFGILGVLIVLLGFINCKDDVCAKGAIAYFGTKDGYEWNVGEKSPMGFYLESDGGNLTEVELIITYDPEILEFQSQKDKVVTILSEGKISVKKEGNLGTRYKKLIYFMPLVSCDTSIQIVEARGMVGEQEVSFEGTVDTSVTIPLKKGCELESIEIDGEGLSGFEPEMQRYPLEVEHEVEILPITVNAPEGTEVEISDTQLEVGSNEITIITTNKKKQKGRYVLEIVREEAAVEVDNAVKEDAITVLTEAESTKMEANTTAAQAVETEVITAKDEIIIIEESVASGESNSKVKEFSWKQWVLIIAIIFVGILVMVEVILFLVRIKKQKERRNKKLEEQRAKNKKLEIEEVAVDETEVNQVVIRGKNICMDFDRAINEYTSIKDLVIQVIKGTKTKEQYRALNDISFEIRKGEVIGVIGTNGAGKSTLLKIIAGAIYPTSGSVEVNRNKIQILTLGTGFDMELTGKENVYLNGAIIGYDREFIDEHYDQIVDFAELQDFMNEKVKNYSSGMVSRLGFAIATVGKAAEILILDEVLSVGDRIFKEKSMKRIKEMIHGGSTVIMVSHSTQTIRDHCNRAIWLEKGNMIAMGDAKKLCAEYDKYDGDYEKVMKEKGDIINQR